MGPGHSLESLWATAVELHSFDPDKTRIPLSGVVALLTALPTWPTKTLILFYTWCLLWQKHSPCPWAPVPKHSKPGWFRRLLFQEVEGRSTQLRPLPAFAHFPIMGRGFFSSPRKLEVHKSNQSAIGKQGHRIYSTWSKHVLSQTGL